MNTLVRRSSVVLASALVLMVCVLQTSLLHAEDTPPGEVNVTGVWLTKIDIIGQTGEAHFTLRQEGDKIAGTYQGLLGKEEVTGTVTGNKVEFGFSTDQGEVTFAGTITKDGMEGEAKYGNMPATWTAERETDAEPENAEPETAKPEKGEDEEEKIPTSGIQGGSVQKDTFEYAVKDSQKLLLDRIVYPSVEVAGKRPVIIFSVGGGWEAGGRDDKGLESGLNHLASLGYTVVSIDYRLGIKIAKANGEMTADNGVEMYLRAIQWGVEDLFDATSYILERADEWNIDKDQIVIMGGSAGATNSLVAEYNVANDTELARAHLPQGFRYAGVISMAGAFWLTADTPLEFKSKPAPILFFHGAKDQLVTYDEVQGPFSGYGPVYYFRKFAGPDYPKWFIDYPEGDHVIAASPTIDCRHEIAAFLQKMVKERQEISVHTVEEGKIPKNFQNASKLFGDLSEKTEDKK